MNIDNVKNILKDIPIFWINLNRATERREKMENYFIKYGLANERIEAIDGNDINLEEYRQIYNVDSKLNKYEVACAFSHLKAIQMCFDKNLDYVLILEDDILFDYFDYKKNTLLFLLCELIKIDGDCIQLCNVISRKLFPTYANNKNLLIKNYAPGNQAYLITKKGMEKVLNNFANTKNVEVSEYMILKKIKTYIVKPYFTYPFLMDENGKKVNLSFIRENSKSAHMTQTISKSLWDEYYKSNETINNKSNTINKQYTL